ncbi:hypothetical protein ACQKML_23955 [Peribacillus frigoritolerans]
MLEECYRISGGEIKNLKRAVQKVAVSNKVDVSSLANHVAFYVSKMDRNWWGAAQNLQIKDDPFNTVSKIFKERININEIDDPIDKELLQNALFE